MTEIERHLLTIQLNKIILPVEQRSEHALNDATAGIKAALTVLDNHLKTREYLLGKDFTIADLNVASVLMVGVFIIRQFDLQFDLSGTPAIEKWFKKCTDREASQRVRGKK
jgi:glutathione S-transferase